VFRLAVGVPYFVKWKKCLGGRTPGGGKINEKWGGKTARGWGGDATLGGKKKTDPLDCQRRWENKAKVGPVVGKVRVGW